MKEEDIHIKEGIRQGQEEVFHSLFLLYYGPLTIFANRYLDDDEMARDIVQELFVHLFEKRRTLKITTSLKSYMYQSVRNRCLNCLKRRKIHEKYHTDISRKTEVGNDLDAQILETELEHMILQKIEKLPVRCRQIFLMSRREGMKNREISEKLDISVRTVETQIYKALALLREELKNYLLPPSSVE